MEHWINKPFILYAMPDKRHGFVARFKKYYPPVQISDVEGLKVLSLSTTLDELKKNWESLTPQEKLLPTILAKKESLKTTLK